jgi:hypothetical protein
MTTVLNVLLDGLLAGSLVLFTVALVQMVLREENASERLLQIMALVAGAVVALGAQATGLSFANYTVEALTGEGGAGAFVKLLSVLIPGGIAAAFSWYFLRVMHESAAKGLRLMAFLGMLTLIGFAEIYAQATNTKGVILGAAAIPNASFVAGMILSLLFFAPDPTTQPGGEGNRFSAVAEILGRKAPQAPARFGGGAAKVTSSTQMGVPAPSNPLAED